MKQLKMINKFLSKILVFTVILPLSSLLIATEPLGKSGGMLNQYPNSDSHFALTSERFWFEGDWEEIYEKMSKLVMFAHSIWLTRR